MAVGHLGIAGPRIVETAGEVCIVGLILRRGAVGQKSRCILGRDWSSVIPTDSVVVWYMKDGRLHMAEAALEWC